MACDPSLNAAARLAAVDGPCMRTLHPRLAA